jgi:aminomethyltransferase
MNAKGRNDTVTDKEICKTPLAEWHEARGATMVDFGGWLMPLWYPSGARSEHMAVITAAGLFDTSHMAVVLVSGPGAFDVLQRCFTKDLRACLGKRKTPLRPGRCVYGAFLNEQGHVIDDAIVYQFATDRYMAVVNAGMGGKIADHLAGHRGDSVADVTDLTGRVGKIDLQGRASVRVLAAVLREPERTLDGLPYFGFTGHFEAGKGPGDACFTDGTPVLLSRSGYTGEIGFELFVSPDRLVGVWETILSAGREAGAIPCGLAARDSLRAGAVLPLSHQDIGPWPFINNPWPFALPFNDDGARFTKEFIGDRVLQLKDSADHTHAFVGKDPRKVSPGDPAVVLDADGNEIGVVLTCVADLAIGREGGRIYSAASPDRPEGFKPRGLCCGFVRVRSRLLPGDTVELKDNRRAIGVTIANDVRPARTARRSIREFM